MTRPTIKRCPVCNKNFREEDAVPMSWMDESDTSVAIWCPLCGSLIIKSDSGEWVEYTD